MPLPPMMTKTLGRCWFGFSTLFSFIFHLLQTELTDAWLCTAVFSSNGRHPSCHASRSHFFLGLKVFLGDDNFCCIIWTSGLLIWTLSNAYSSCSSVGSFHKMILGRQYLVFMLVVMGEPIIDSKSLVSARWWWFDRLVSGVEVCELIEAAPAFMSTSHMSPLRLSVLVGVWQFSFDDSDDVVMVELCRNRFLFSSLAFVDELRFGVFRLLLEDDGEGDGVVAAASCCICCCRSSRYFCSHFRISVLCSSGCCESMKSSSHRFKASKGWSGQWRFACVNRIWQPLKEQEKGRSPVCSRWCVLSWPDWVKARLQPGKSHT